MATYEIYYSDKRGNSIGAWSRTRKESAIRFAEKIELKTGETVRVLKDKGPQPGDYVHIFKRP